MTIPSRISCIALCLLAADCGSSPQTRYYLLNALAPATTVAVSVATAQPPLRVEPLDIPPELDRLQLVMHTGTNAVRIDDVDRWAAPLEDQIRQIVSSDLAQRLPPGAVVDPNEPATTAARRLLSITIAQLEVDAACHVTLRADWSVRETQDSSRGGTLQLQDGGGGSCPTALPAALSRTLAALSDQLIAALGAAS